MHRSVLACCALAALTLPSLVFADVQYQQTTRITGGSLLSMMKMAGRFSKAARQGAEPVTQTVMLKGNRMATVGKESTDIIDLDAETFTNIDHAGRQYSVVTFAEMRQAIEDSARETEKRMKGKDGSEGEVSFTAKVRDGNQTKQIAGLATRLMILTLEVNAQNRQSGEQGALSITSDMWMAPDIPGYAEVRDFHRRMAEKMGVMLGGGINPMMAQRGMGKAFADMAKEVSKLQGVPVFQVTRMGAAADGRPLPSAAEAPLPPSRDPQMPSAGEMAAEGATRSATSEAQSQLSRGGALGRVAGGAIGGFGGFGRRKKQQEPPPEPEQPKPAAQQQEQQALASVLMEMEQSLTGFTSGSVDGGAFAVPAGYAKVDSPLKKRH